MKSGIYKITNKQTGKSYVGSAKDIDWRWYEHTRDLKTNKHCNPKLQHSWNFYGEDVFEFTIIEETSSTQEILFEREQFYLDTIKPYMREIGYNISPTAHGGDNITHHPNRNTFIEKMIDICSGEGNPMFGKNHSKKTIRKQKTKAKGRFTLEWFIKKYGKEKGQEKYDERRLMLANRKSFSHPAWNKGKTTQKWKHKDGWLEKRKATEEYFKYHYDEFKTLVMSNKYSQRELCKKLNIGRSAVRKHWKNIRKNPEEIPPGFD